MAHHFKKQYGQNFLKFGAQATKIIHPLNLSAGEPVVEIGPGEGVVTSQLLSKGAKVTAIEIDYDLIVTLVKKFGQIADFDLLHEDFLTSDLKFDDLKYKACGSLPYNVSKPIIMKLITQSPRPAVASLLVQKEVAQDYVATAPKASFLSNWIQIYATVRISSEIPRRYFHPTPQVDGAVLVLTPHPEQPAPDFASGFTSLLRLGFATPRKTLWNNLRSGSHFEEQALTQAWSKLGLTNFSRAAELDFDTWRKLYTMLG